MDLWVVAAAAGAGYIAKNLQNLPSSKKERLESSGKLLSTHTSLESRNLLQQIRDKTCPLRRLAQKREPTDTSSKQKDGLDRRVLDMEQISSSSSSTGSRMASNTSTSNVVKEDYNVVWLSSLQNLEFLDEDCSPFEFGKFKLLKNRPSSSVMRPLSSLPQLCQKHEKVEEYVYSSFPSPCLPSLRPLLITEGTEMISRSNGISSSIWSHSSVDIITRGACWNEKISLSNDPCLENTISVELHNWRSGSTKTVSSKESHSPGSPNTMLLFVIGITIGIISRIMANEKEVTTLNEQLNQVNNLVQDLQEELEMKEQLTVKDLANEDSQSLSIKNSNLFNQELIPSVPETQTDKHETSEMDNAKTAEPTLKNEVEKELEAELERLELNVKTSLQDRISRHTALDLDLEVDTIQEDMKLDLPRRQYDDDSSERDYDAESGTATDHTLNPNYAVSPRELAICLHELMESRLQSRIKELETALKNSQNRLQYLESECITFQGISSVPESPASVYNG